MLTVRLKLKEKIDVSDFQRQFGNVVRYSFNRCMEGTSKFDVFRKLYILNNLPDLDLSWKREAAKVGCALAKSALARYEQTQDKKDLKVIFGGKGLFYKRLNGSISKDEYKKLKKLQPITCEGSKADTRGNRKFKFDFASFTGYVRLGKKRVTFACHKTSKKNLELLSALEEMLDKKEIGVTYQITSDYLYIVFDLDKFHVQQPYKKVKDRTLAIDSNPNYIGFCIMEGDEVIFRKAYDLSSIINDSKKGKTFAQRKHEKDKKKYEIVQVVLDIKKICIKYGVSLVGFEKLNIKSQDKQKGRKYNKKVNNDWCRELFFNSLKKHLTLIGCRYQEIDPRYSSFIGCIMYPDETDSVAASIELNRRLRTFRDIYIDKTAPKGAVLYPKYSSDFLNRWKKDGMTYDECDGWVSVYRCFKKSGHSYRLLYDEYVKRTLSRVSSLKSRKSKVSFIETTDRIQYFR